MEIPLLDRTIDLDLYEEVIARSSRYLGVYKLTAEQYEAVTAFLSGKDVFVSLPTGGGKSLCFAVIPKAVELFKTLLGLQCLTATVMLVVSPLVSLMQDQVNRFQGLGLPSIALNALNDGKVLQAIKDGKYQLVFLSPETLRLQRFRELFGEESFTRALAGIAVDEAHCINDW